MKSKKEIVSNDFSAGKFQDVYSSMADNIEWNIIGSNSIKGKNAVVEHCDKMRIEIANSILNNTNHVISENQVVVQGYCQYEGQNNEQGRVEYCDIYKFNGQLLVAITSYVVDVKG